MASFRILSVAVVCGMIVSVSGQQVFKTKLTYEAAKASCESMGLRMAVDFSAAKHDALKHAADESAGFQLIKSDYWINGRVGSDDVVTTNEGRRLINYQKWNIGEPSGNGDCLQLWGLAGHNWDDDNCGHEKYYICEHEAADDYIVFADDESQEDARKECNQYGLVLAKDTSNKVHNAILNVVRNSEANGGDVWIDGRRGSDDIVETSDGDRLTKYHPWAAGEPTGNDVCLQLWSSRDYDWDDDSCNNKDSFVCQQPEKRLTVYIDQQSHDDALATCVGVGMVLAKDDSDEKHQTLIDAIKDSPADGKDVWIDGIRGSDNIVVTTDGQRMTDYHPWAWLEPLRNGVCIQLWDWRDYDWDDDSCLNTDPFICEPAAQKLTVFDVPKTRDQAIEAAKPSDGSSERRQRCKASNPGRRGRSEYCRWRRCLDRRQPWI
ncbi:uncharacterized protein [Ptychodera flava]|uniref:uncharacterized protein n=1 Tax=Ptychodera flava TaxID=63121 RepID=UPI00396A1882